MTNPSYPWQAAFVAYCNAAPLEEISAIFEIPLDTLTTKAGDEGWKGLRNKLALITNPSNNAAVSQVESGGLSVEVASKLKLVAENRIDNLKVFVKLREHLVESVKALADGTLEIERVFNGKLGIVTHRGKAGPADWVNISTYARTVADGTYRALGDFQGGKNEGQDAAAGTLQPPAPSITIILPAAIARPRQEREIHDAKQSQVIDLTDVKVG